MYIVEAEQITVIAYIIWSCFGVIALGLCLWMDERQRDKWRGK